MEQVHHNNPGYRTYFLVFLGLALLLFLSIGSTKIDLGISLVAVSMIIALFQAILVLMTYMHLRFANRMYIVMLLVVIIVYVAVIFFTFFDYSFR